MSAAAGNGRPRVLVAEKIGASGISLLEDSFDVELGFDWRRERLAERIGEFDGILIRSATKLDAELIARADRLRAVGRAGVGVDNVDVRAATARGIVVANAPESNVITAAEHTMALLLALARNIPQAHASLTSGKWERSKFSGTELHEKTLKARKARLGENNPATLISQGNLASAYLRAGKLSEGILLQQETLEADWYISAVPFDRMRSEILFIDLVPPAHLNV